MKQRDIVLVPFPFSDQSGQKVRPALVLSNNTFNQSSHDVLVCAITTTLKPSKYSIIIDQNDLESGILHEKSSVKAEAVLRMNKALIIKTIATVKKSTFAKVVLLVSGIIKQE